MTGRAPGLLAIGALSGLASMATGSFVTAPQRDPGSGSDGPRSVAVSADGRFVAFESYAPLVPADTNDRRDVYVLELATRRVTLESTGQGSDANAGHPRLSADGRFLVYESTAIAADLSYRSSIVLCDRATGAATVVSRSAEGRPADGASTDPDISDDGRIVVFASNATNLVAAIDARERREDIYAFDAQTGTIRRVSVDSQGVRPATGASVSPSLSGDGRSVAFVSSAPLIPHSAGRAVYVRDMAGLTTVRVSPAGPAAAAGRDSWSPAIDRVGRMVAFVSAADSGGSGARNRTPNVFLRDLVTGGVTLVSRAADGEAASGTSGSPAISADGRFVAFQSDAANLVCSRRCPPGAEDINLLPDIFVFDRDRSSVARVSEDASGGWMEASRGPALDSSGQVLAFTSRHPTDGLDNDNDFDLFVRFDAGPAEPHASDHGGIH